MKGILKVGILTIGLTLGISFNSYAEYKRYEFSDSYKEAQEEKNRIKDLKAGLGDNDKSVWVYKYGDWYYFDISGSLKTGWFTTGDKYDENGKRIVETYYTDEKGRMQTGWIQNTDGRWYYLSESGALLTNTTTPDGFTVDENGTWIESLVSEQVSERRTPIEIFKVRFSTNFLGGVSPTIWWRNNSGKVIKYIYFDMIPYNAVGDVPQCEIRRSSAFSGYVTGPIETEEGIGDYILKENGYLENVKRDYDGNACYTISGKKTSYTQEENRRSFSLKHSWDCAWYNSSISEIRITGIRIEYMDGTSQSVNPADVMYSN